MADELDTTVTTTETTQEAPADAATQGVSVDQDNDSTVLGGATETAVAADVSADGEKPVEAAAEGAPEAYTLTPPDGMTLDADALAIAEPIFREMDLNNEGAQKVTDAYAKIAPMVAEKAVTADRAMQEANVIAQRKAWFDEARADPEVGGANWDASVTASAKALNRLGAPVGSPFRELLETSGLGNHVEMVRIFAKIGKAVGEDSDFISAKATSPIKQDAAETLYPDDKRKGA